MNAASLGEARRLLQARQFSAVIRVLEPEVFRYRDNFDFYYLLGLACLHTGDFGGAFSYLSRARQLKDDDANTLLGLAAIHLRKGEHESAIKRWLEALEIEPGNRVASRGLSLLRRGPGPDELRLLIESSRVRQLYPSLPSRRRWARALVIGLACVAVVGLGYLGYRGYQDSRSRMSERPGVGAIEIPLDLTRLIETGTDFRYTLTERQVKDEFQAAKKYLLAYRDNMAAVEINRLLLSNAALPVKERARMLKGFVTQPTFETLRDSFPYATVRTEPELYDGCSVSWRGKVANLRIGKDAISFDFLVGYEREKELQGIVPVSLPFAAQLSNGDPLELLATVVATNGGLALRGISLHRLVSP